MSAYAVGNCYLFKRILAITVLSLSTTYGVHAADIGKGASTSDGKAGSSGNSMQMHQSMMKDMKEMESMPMSGDMDRDFAMMMRKHHQSGVNMAEMEMKQGKDVKMRDMAKNIIETQKKEIKEFDDWLSKQKSGGK